MRNCREIDWWPPTTTTPFTPLTDAWSADLDAAKAALVASGHSGLTVRHCLQFSDDGITWTPAPPSTKGPVKK